jgi:hypothetical protein
MIVALLSAVLLYAMSPTIADDAILFENIGPKSGINCVLNNSVTENRHQVETMIAGVGVFDYDNDGLLDLYFANGAKLPGMEKSDPSFWNRLYHNNGDGTFTDATEKAGVRGKGYAMGVAVADYDNDGWEDLFVSGVNYNQLFHNNHDGTFIDVTQKAGLSGILPNYGKTWAIGAGWFDYDNDGELDLLIINYVQWSVENEPECQANTVRAYCSPDSYQGLPNILYHNNGDGTFTDVSESSKIGKYIGKGMGVVFADYDNDGWTDIFVSNDTFRHFLFHNEHNGAFTENAVLKGVAYNENGKSIAGMGADFKDVDNDGRADIFVVAMVGDTFPLFYNRGRFFEDVTSISGVAAASVSSTGWGAGVFDFDNDGFKDLFVARAAILDNAEMIDHVPAKLPNAIYRNLGGKKFVDVSSKAGPGLQLAAAHRGAAFGDLNNDGKMDVVVNCLNEKPEILLNQSRNRNHWLTLELTGTKSNRDGLGARVWVTAGGITQFNHATTSVGYAASSDRRVHFGLGETAAIAQKVEIEWPSGIRQTLLNVPADQILKIREENP